MPRATILTALPVEYLAVRQHLNELQEELHPQGSVYERGLFTVSDQCWRVGIAEIGVGNMGAAVEAERAIAHFQPDVLLFVGIAGGIKDVAIGDVVAATKVYGYESGKVEDNQFSLRPTLEQSAHALVQRARAEARKGDWFRRVSESNETVPRVLIAPIAAGEKIIASTQSGVYQFLRNSYNDAIAVEMEGYGVLSAAFAYPTIQAMVIRGISDLIDGKNDQSVSPERVCQQRAATHASAFAFEVLSKLRMGASEQMGATASKTEVRLQGDRFSVLGEGRSSNKSLSVTERLALVRRLNALPTSQFDELVLVLNPPKGVVPPDNAAQGNRTAALVNWVEGSTGKGLAQLQEGLALIMNRESALSAPALVPEAKPRPPSDARRGFYERQRLQLESDLKTVEADLATAQTTLAQEKLSRKAEQLLEQIEELNSRLT